MKNSETKTAKKDESKNLGKNDGKENHLGSPKRKL